MCRCLKLFGMRLESHVRRAGCGRFLDGSLRNAVCFNAWHGEAGRGMAWHGEVFGHSVRTGSGDHLELGEAGHGTAWQGQASQVLGHRVYRLGGLLLTRGGDWRGTAWKGKVRRGKVRRGKARFFKVWFLFWR